ncbi:Methyl-accepting chemotaxis sensor/transducer protein [hydrothermal vent metagenome]|uniref:Methyl-accepting chemotaxis sensor/transducer protein n=1 Tax=hydrothermal vent metagenome TaxID=652676 RepID=A0A3B0XJR9_9ZZZZ
MGVFSDLSGFISKMGLALKFSLITGATLIFLLSISAVITLQQQSSSLDDLMDSSKEIMRETSEKQSFADKENEKIKANQLIKLLAQIAPSAIAEFNLTGLLNYANVAVEDPDISYVSFYDKEGNQLIESGDRNEAADDALLVSPITYEDEIFGKVELGYNHMRDKAREKENNSNAEKNFTKMTLSKENAYNHILTSQIILSLFIAFIAVSVIFIIAKSLTRPLNTAITVANQIASGDLTAQFEIKSKDETGQLLLAIKTMLEKLQLMVVHINGTTSELGVTVDQMSNVSKSTAKGTSAQLKETGMLAAAMTQMSSSVQEVANNAADASKSAQNASQETGNGKRVVQDNIRIINSLAEQVGSASNVIEELQLQSNTIGSVLDVIRGIAEQTNLLALNAAIEAARAGDQGRGFAVVADEVRTLAGRTQQATDEIRNMIEKLQDGSENAVRVMTLCQEQAGTAVKQTADAGNTLESIDGAISIISDMNIQIASAVNEQGHAASEIEKNIYNITAVSERTVEGTNVLESANDDLRTVSSKLTELINQFTT